MNGAPYIKRHYIRSQVNKKNHKKLTVRGGGAVNAYGQPDRKISAIFFTTPPINAEYPENDQYDQDYDYYQELLLII